MDFLLSPPVPLSPHSGNKRRANSEISALSSPRDTGRQRLSSGAYSPPVSPKKGRIPEWATPPKSPKSPFGSPKGRRRSTSGDGNPSPGSTSSPRFDFVQISPSREKAEQTESTSSSSPSVGRNRSLSSPKKPRDQRSNNSSSNNLLSSLDRELQSSDRFIPNRDNVDFDAASHLLIKASIADENGVDTDSANLAGIAGKSTKVHSSINRTHLGVISNVTGNSPNVRIFGGNSSHHRNQNKSGGEIGFVVDDGFTRLREEKASSSVSELATGAAAAAAVAAGMSVHAGSSPAHAGKLRYIPSQPSRILDAPDLMDDYYLNLLSWGSNNVIAVALNQSVYLWHAVDGHIDNLCTLSDEDYITSVQWSSSENTLAIGTSANIVELWDSSKLSKVRTLQGHTNRVSSLSWVGQMSPALLSSGGRDGCVISYDTRTARGMTTILQGHSQEVCGLSWSPDGCTLASGGNENRLCLWDACMSQSRVGQTNNSSDTTPRFTIEQHNAAVKAVSWCPWQRNILASGGGTADRTIRLWNTSLGSNLRTVDTGSQVCALQWSTLEKEIVSSHGFSDNQIILWKYSQKNSSLTRLRDFHGHSSRVLHLAKSPDGATVCSASADETIRFWEIFGSSGASISRRDPQSRYSNRKVGVSHSPLSRPASTLFAAAGKGMHQIR